MNQVLGLVGRAGVGRRTMAAYLKEQYGISVLRFTDLVLGEMAPAYGLAPAQMEEWGREIDTHEELAVINCTDPEFRGIAKRIYYQSAREAGVFPGAKDWLFAPMNMGVAMHYWMNMYRIDKGGNPNYWLSLMQTKVQLAQAMGDDKIVITDVSHQRQMVYIKRGGIGTSATPFQGTIVRLRRPGAMKGGPFHEANIDRELIDHTIDNDEDIAKLATTTDKLLVDIGWSAP